MDFENHDEVLNALKAEQQADYDMRNQARECSHFVNKRDGQWEPEIINRFKGKPRYTDDRVNPIVNQIVGEINNADFAIKVSPGSGEATKESAEIFEGLIRVIENISDASEIYNHAARVMTETGFAAWEIVQDYADGDTFDQDLMIKPIEDALDRVWFVGGDLSRTRKESEGVWVFDFVTPEYYEEKWPEGKKASLWNDSWSDVYYYKTDFIQVARFFYKESYTIKLLRLSDGRIVEDDDDFRMIQDDLEMQGIVIEEEREREDYRVKVRYMDASGWLDDAEDTVFNHLPIIPVYANYKVNERKILYRGVVDKLIDMQRVHNYAFSRNVEEVALSPRKKLMMTKKQAQGHENQLRSLNTNMDPVQFWNPDPEAGTPPFEAGAPTPNQAVIQLTQSSEQAIGNAAGLFSANMGDNPGLQSGVAIEKQIDKGNNGTSEYFEAMQVAITRTAKVLVDTIPEVYDATRQVRLLGEDGSVSFKVLNQPVIDNDTGQVVTINDLSLGNYAVACDIGAKYKNRMQESAEQFALIAQRDPSIMQLAADIWFKNMEAPGFDSVAERARAQMMNAGMIPPEQMTEEERAQYEQAQAQAQQQPQTDPAAMAMAEAEMLKGQAEMLNAQNKQAELQLNAQKLQLEASKIQLGRQSQIEKTQSETALNVAKVEQEQQKIDLSQSEQQFNQMMEIQKTQAQQLMEAQRMQAEQIKMMAETMEKIKNAMGVDAIVSPQGVEAYQQVTEGLTDAIEQQGPAGQNTQEA